MYFYNQDQILYPNYWEYSYMMTLEKLADLVTENGGKVQPHKFNTGYIQNRTLFEKINKEKEHNESFKRVLKGMWRKGQLTITEYRSKVWKCSHRTNQEIKKLEAVKNDPVKTNYPGYIHFILNGFYYEVYYSESQFAHVFTKQPVRPNNTISDNYYSSEVKVWFLDNNGLTDLEIFFDTDKYNNSLKQAAADLLNFLENAKTSEKYIDFDRVRVSNTYNSGYHYEKKYKPERTKKIDF